MHSWDIEAHVPGTVIVLDRGKFVLIRYNGERYYEVLPNRNPIKALKGMLGL